MRGAVSFILVVLCACASRPTPPPPSATDVLGAAPDALPASAVYALRQAVVERNLIPLHAAVRMLAAHPSVVRDATRDDDRAARRPRLEALQARLAAGDARFGSEAERDALAERVAERLAALDRAPDPTRVDTSRADSRVTILRAYTDVLFLDGMPDDDLRLLDRSARARLREAWSRHAAWLATLGERGERFVAAAQAELERIAAADKGRGLGAPTMMHGFEEHWAGRMPMLDSTAEPEARDAVALADPIWPWRVGDPLARIETEARLRLVWRNVADGADPERFVPFVARAIADRDLIEHIAFVDERRRAARGAAQRALDGELTELLAQVDVGLDHRWRREVNAQLGADWGEFELAEARWEALAAERARSGSLTPELRALERAARLTALRHEVDAARRALEAWRARVGPADEAPTFASVVRELIERHDLDPGERIAEPDALRAATAAQIDALFGERLGAIDAGLRALVIAPGDEADALREALAALGEPGRAPAARGFDDAVMDARRLAISRAVLTWHAIDLLARLGGAASIRELAHELDHAPQLAATLGEKFQSHIDELVVIVKHDQRPARIEVLLEAVERLRDPARTLRASTLLGTDLELLRRFATFAERDPAAGLTLLEDRGAEPYCEDLMRLMPDPKTALRYVARTGEEVGAITALARDPDRDAIIHELATSEATPRFDAWLAAEQAKTAALMRALEAMNGTSDAEALRMGQAIVEDAQRIERADTTRVVIVVLVVFAALVTVVWLATRRSH